MRRDGHEQPVICGELETSASARNSQGQCGATLRGEAGAEWTGLKSDAVTDFGCPSIDYLSNVVTAQHSYGNLHSLKTALSFFLCLVSIPGKTCEGRYYYVILIVKCSPWP